MTKRGKDGMGAAGVADGTGPSSMDSRQAGQYLGCSAASLRLWRATGKGPRYFRVGRLVRYRRADLDAWTQEHSVAPERR